MKLFTLYFFGYKILKFSRLYLKVFHKKMNNLTNKNDTFHNVFMFDAHPSFDTNIH